MKSTSLVCLTAAIALAAHPSSAATRTWNKAAGGTYEWNAGNFGGTLPTADDDADFGGLSNTYRPAGDQTIAGDGAARTLDFHNSAYSTSRTFTGDITASNIVLRVGTVNIDGTLNLTGTDQTYSLVGAAVFDNAHQGGTLNIRNGGTLRADGVHGICVGRRASADNNNASGRIVLEKGGRLVLNPSGATASMAGLQLGRLDGSRSGTYSASYVQKGGEAVLGRIMTGFEKNTFAGLSILGGSLDLPRINNDTRFRVANYGYGSFQLLGGEVNCETNYSVNLDTAQDRFATRAFAFEVGVGRSITNGLKGAYFYANNGTFRTGSDFAVSGATGADTGDCAPLHATIDGNARVEARTMRIGANKGGSAAILNLNGGVLRSDFIFADEGRKGASVVNADGGRICFERSALQQQFLFIDAVNIYEGGLEIEVARNEGVYIGNAGTNVVLRTSTGYGVDISGITNIDSSLTPPWIEISGGSGSNATAVAFVDYDTDVMTNAAMVCRGEGYAAGDRPVAKVIRPYGTTTLTNRIALSVSENRPGKLIKTGGYNLSIFAQPEFAGTYEVRQGYMIQSTAAGVASPKVAAVIVGGTYNATFQTGSGNATAVEENWNPVNPAATLTLGTAYGPGCLRVPAAATGQTKPFEQTFASLSVSGVGNEIGFAQGNSKSGGAKVVFGTITCAEESELTIPDWDSTFKVYVDTTKTPVGRRFRNIKFNGAGPEVFAEVAEDGQLVKAKTGLVLILR